MTNIENIFEENENITSEQEESYLIQVQDDLIHWIDEISTYQDRLEEKLTRDGKLIESYPLINEFTDMALYEDRKILYETFSEDPKESWEEIFNLEED